MELIKAVLAGERLALARLLTQVENDTSEGRAALDQLFPYTGRAHLVGVTGSPGTGKSTLVNQLAQVFRKPLGDEPARQVAIVAVDPSSPFTGGALLGDRIRMRSLAGDAGIFIRSMASRGALGGLSRTTAAVTQVLDAAGFEIILIETVGVGQAEVDIARLAHTTVVVEAPGLGDDIQAIKAGILEIADILVVNKADLPGVEATTRALRAMLELVHPERLAAVPCPPGGTGEADEVGVVPAAGNGWAVPVLQTTALDGCGIEELARGIDAHRYYLQSTTEWQRRTRARLQNELETLLQATLFARWRSGVSAEHYERLVQQLCSRDRSPFQVVGELLGEY